MGVDISNITICEARERYLNIEFKNTSATELPFPEESFDFHGCRTGRTCG